jgi:alkylation response protein AidB-like acyl-CoA dehydrogenase
MNFTHTEDRRMLADSLNRFVSEQYGIEQRNHLAYGAEGHSPALYAQFAELGAIGALFPKRRAALAARALTSAWCSSHWAVAWWPSRCWARWSWARP